MLNLKNNKGSITLFVLVSCMFFLTTITCINMYIQNKQISIDRKYKQIKSNYESGIKNINEAHEQPLQLNNFEINLMDTAIKDNTLSAKIKLENITDLNITSLKYGWSTNQSSDYIKDWTFVESSNDTILAVNNNINTSEKYYLFVVVNGIESYIEIIPQN